MNRFLQQGEVAADTQTGLVWTRSASVPDFQMTWQEALAFIREINRAKLHGFDDWKLPNRRELFSLVSHAAVNPSLPPGHPFADVFAGYYWTSTTCARLPDQAWYVHLGGARVFKGMKHGSYMVWPVRIADGGSRVFQTGQRRCYGAGGSIADCRDTGQDGELQAGLGFGHPRFLEDSDCVYDRATGLTWLKRADYGDAMLDWQSARNLVNEMNRARVCGHDDWRLPRIRELESLADMGRHSPALPAGHPFSGVRKFYWSATSSRYDERYAWALYLEDGAVGVGYKPLAEFYLWPVRGNVTERCSRRKE